MPELVKQYFRTIYNELKSESATYQELKEKIERHVSIIGYTDNLWGAIVKRELLDAFTKEVGSLLINKLP